MYFWRDSNGDHTEFLGPFSITQGAHCLEARCIRESGAGANDGEIELFVDGVSQGSSNTIDNFDAWNADAPDRITCEFLGVSSPNITGSLYYDEFIIDGSNVADLGCGVGEYAIAPMTRPADVDADGTNVYIALLSGGSPILIKILADLSADGSIVYQPGGGRQHRGTMRKI